MKKIWILVIAVVLFSGCTAITTQYNLMNRMGTYTFNSPAGAVYAGAVELFRKDRLPLTSTDVNTGVSTWKKTYRSQGSLSHAEDIRFVVEVRSVGKNRSVVRVYKESIPDKRNPAFIGKTLGSEIVKADRIRHIPTEYRILQFINPAEAKNLEAKASK